MKRFARLRPTVCLLLASCLVGACATAAGTAESRPEGSAGVAGQSSGSDSADTPVTSPGYRLLKGDEISINVFNEGEFSVAQRIDNRGIVRLPYAGEINLANRTVREAETYLEGLLKDKKLLREPMVTIVVREYSSREVSVLGAVGRAGKFNMPREASEAEIVDVITAMGGLRPTAKGNDVQVTRTADDGKETVTQVDVEAMINPRRDRNAPRSFLIYPGDRIYVPERLW